MRKIPLLLAVIIMLGLTHMLFGYAGSLYGDYNTVYASAEEYTVEPPPATANVAELEPEESPPEDGEDVPTWEKILDFIMNNFWALLLTVLGGAGIALVAVWRYVRQIGEALIAIANFGEGTGSWDKAKDEIKDIIELLMNRNPVDTVIAAKNAKKLKAKVKARKI